MKKRAMVVGFWLRLVTDILDAMSLAVFGYLIIGLPFRGLGARLAGRLRLIYYLTLQPTLGRKHHAPSLSQA